MLRLTKQLLASLAFHGVIRCLLSVGSSDGSSHLRISFVWAPNKAMANNTRRIGRQSGMDQKIQAVRL